MFGDLNDLVLKLVEWVICFGSVVNEWQTSTGWRPPRTARHRQSVRLPTLVPPQT